MGLLIGISWNVATKNVGVQDRGEILNEGMLGKKVIQRRVLDRRKEGRKRERRLLMKDRLHHWLSILTTHDKVNFLKGRIPAIFPLNSPPLTIQTSPKLKFYLDNNT